MNDITEALIERGFRFKSNAGHQNEQNNKTRHITFNKLENNISIIGYIAFYRRTQTASYKTSIIDLSREKRIINKEEKHSNLDALEARKELLKFIDTRAKTSA